MLADHRRFVEVMKFSYEQTMAAAGIYSLSENPLDLLMWPHYADNHRGVCIRFSLTALLNQNLVPLKVNYAPARPVSDPILESTTAMLEKGVLTKSAAWSYEREWRLVQNRGARQVVALGIPTIDGVILGAGISDHDRQKVVGWVRDARRPVELFQAQQHSRDYMLELVPMP